MYFFELPTDGVGFISSFEVTGVRRFGSFAGVAAAGLACLWTLAPLRSLFGRKIFWAGPLVVGLFGLGLGSGYRNALIVPVLVFVLLSFFQRFWNPRSLFAGAMVLMAVILGLYASADKLPLSIQRSISFLPGIEISHFARTDARATDLDRIDVLEMVLADVPRYWLVGRGFGMERLDQLPLDTVHAGAVLLYSQGMFYNGFLGSLLKTGVIGMIFSVVFVVIMSRATMNLVKLVRRRSLSEQTFFDRFCLMISAHWFAMVCSFYLTNGDVNWWMQFFGLSSALILACRRRQQELVDEETAVAPPQQEPVLENNLKA